MPDAWSCTSVRDQSLIAAQAGKIPLHKLAPQFWQADSQLII